MSLDLLPLSDDQRVVAPEGYPAPIVSSIVNGLLERGMTVTAITSSYGITDTAVYENGPLRLVVVPRRGPRSAFRMFRSERAAIADAVRQYQPEVLSAHWSYEFAAAALDSGVPTLITIRDHALTVLKMTARDQVDFGSWAKRLIYRGLRLLLDASVLRRGQWFSVTSPYMLRLLPERVRKRTRVIPNFVNLVELLALAPPEGRERRIVTVSNGFGGRKNIAVALCGFAMSEAVREGWTYELIGGEMGSGGPANAWADAHGLAAGLVFRGQIPYKDALESIGSSGMMIHPALEESFGMTVLEAMALDTPVIGGLQSGNVPDLLAHGAGVLCDVGSPGAIATAIDDLAKDHAKREMTVFTARARVATSYSQQAVLDSYVKYLEYVARSTTVDGGTFR